MPEPLAILLVDDHQDSRDVFTMYMESQGHQVVAAGSMREALSQLAEHRIDLMIADIGLPDGTGWELLRRIRQTRQLPAIAMSGFGTAEDVRRSLDAGFTVHIVKPVKLADIDKALQAVINSLRAAP
jgi:CheY-like chemotaxis protein